jgi:hypothetical protein
MMPDEKAALDIDSRDFQGRSPAVQYQIGRKTRYEAFSEKRNSRHKGMSASRIETSSELTQFWRYLIGRSIASRVLYAGLDCTLSGMNGH